MRPYPIFDKNSREPENSSLSQELVNHWFKRITDYTHANLLNWFFWYCKYFILSSFSCFVFSNETKLLKQSSIKNILYGGKINGSLYCLTSYWGSIFLNFCLPVIKPFLKEIRKKIILLFSLKKEVSNSRKKRLPF